MEKIKIEYEAPENVIVRYKKNNIEVIPYLDAGTQAGLIARYIQDLYDESGAILTAGVDKRRFNAELAQMLYILESNTSIDVTSINENLFIDSELWHDIIAEISNYEQFRIRLEEIVMDYEDQLDKLTSFGVVISDIMEKLSSFVNSLGDLTPESIAALQETGKSLIEQLEQSKIVQDMERGEE